MLSRVGDRIYWMSRFMERAENLARILGVTSNVVLCSTPETQQQNLLAPLTITASTRGFFERHEVVSMQSFFDWVKERSHLFRGVTYGTIMRGEAFNFSRLGTFIERADDTARILDVKYHILLPRVEDVGGALDYYQWAALLKSVSSFETYRIIYRDQIRPINVAELLILDRRMPRSLAACLEQIDAALSRVDGENDQ